MKPAQEDTLATLYTLLKQVPKNDCIIMLGDFNEQLQANIQGVTGKWTGGKESANDEKIVEMMRLNNLIAANILFQPSNSVHTYLQTKRKGMEDVIDEPVEKIGTVLGTKQPMARGFERGQVIVAQDFQILG